MPITLLHSYVLHIHTLRYHLDLLPELLDASDAVIDPLGLAGAIQDEGRRHAQYTPGIGGFRLADGVDGNNLNIILPKFILELPQGRRLNDLAGCAGIGPKVYDGWDAGPQRRQIGSPPGSRYLPAGAQCIETHSKQSDKQCNENALDHADLSCPAVVTSTSGAENPGMPSRFS
jgi:hypothetical protein